MRLLIVDDEPIIREGIQRLVDFEALGIDVVDEAENGEKALIKFETYLPDIVLADINMPKMDGLEFAKRIKAIKPEVKIALITGYDYFDYAREAIKIGVDDYILKPVSKSDITALLSELCAKVTILENENAVRKISGDGEKFEITENEVTDLADYKQKISSYLSDHIYDPSLSLSDMASHLGLSNGYLSGLFKKTFGMSFKEYVLKNRLDKAKILILSTGMKNYEISSAVGMSDPNYFSTAFKKYTGLSPNRFRESRGL